MQRPVARLALLICATSVVACGAENELSRLPSPDRAALESAIALAGSATVKITGTACGLATAGSGVVVAPHMVVTAAHVVAGSTESHVLDSSGAHDAVPVVVDPLFDLAALYVEALDDQWLPISAEPAQRGTTGAVLGYPHAGTFESSPAIVLDAYRA